ncbi:MAG: mechanosensitive ion channel family protein, partial [Bacteroidetes bacterium]|nr:mechanosensitive ion channel family protein [Bacteroidota bacterium]
MKEQVVVVDDYLNRIINFGIEYAPKLLGGIVVLFVGLWVIKFITKTVGKSLA